MEISKEDLTIINIVTNLVLSDNTPEKHKCFMYGNIMGFLRGKYNLNNIEEVLASLKQDNENTNLYIKLEKIYKTINIYN